MKFTAFQIAKISDCTIPPTILSNPDAEIEHLLIDSRSCTWPDTSAFFALRTLGNDGHKYIRELSQKGVKTFVVEYIPEQLKNLPDVNFIVGSPAHVLGSLARYARSTFHKPVIGITGSRGKTVVKEMLYRMLRGKYSVIRSPRSWNSQIGVPLSVCRLDSDYDIAIFEAGVSRSCEMRWNSEIIRPTIGVFTSITDEHDEGFSSKEQKCREKATLFNSCQKIFYPAADRMIAQTLCEMYPSDKLVPVEGNQPADLCRAIVDYIDPTLDEDADVSVAENIPITRLDLHEGVNNCLMVYDNFTCDLDSLAGALDFTCRRSTSSRTTTLIVSDLEHGLENPDIIYREMARLLAAKKVDRMIAIGDEIAAHKHLFSPMMHQEYIPDTDTFLDNYDISHFNSELILIKGAPGFGFDEIKRQLEAPRHETILEVNLDAVVHNFNQFRKALNPGTGIVAMVKASGYGIGALELAKTLQSQGAAYLAVAVVDEGVELRQGGITMPIMVLNPIGTNYRALFMNHLEASVFSIRELQLLIKHATRYGVKNYPIHIKLDTGMHRVGFVADELDELCRIIKSTDTVRVMSIFSHLATADCLDLDNYTESQLNTFERMSTKIIDTLGYSIKRHILNTAGILRYPQYQHEMVRLGIGLYGISPIPTPDEGGLRPVARFTSTIASIKHWPAGTHIGYGGRGITTRPSVIATIPVGYADGIDRHLGNGAASFIVNSAACPTIGNICMDQCMIDVTDANASIGDEVEIFGPSAPLRRLSDTLDTIPYEILTSVSPRVKRIYYRE